MIKHLKTNTIPAWTQADLDAQIALGNYPPGTTLANITLSSDWNSDHVITTLDMAGTATPAYLAGRLAYDTTNESLTFYNNDSNVSLQVGQEEWIRVINNTGSTIQNGSAVYLNGASAGLPTIALAQANAGATTIGAGLTTEAIASGAIGYVTCIGVVHGLDTSAFSAGQTVYISSTVAGGLVSAAPLAPNFRYRIGIVAVSDASVGSIHVTPSTASLGNGTANQLFGMNTAGTAQELKTLVAGTNITLTPGTGTITIDATGGSGGTPGGVSGNIQYNNAGAFAGAGTIDSSANMSAIGTIASSVHTITATNAKALAVGLTGATNPAFAVDTSTASSATGILVQSKAAATSSVTAIATSSAADCDLLLSSKGAGAIALTGGSSGSVTLNPGGNLRLTVSASTFTGSTLVNYAFNTAVSNTAATVRFGFTGSADAALTAGAEAPSAYFNMGQTRTHASNTAITLQRDFRITPSTHAFVTAGGVIATAASLYIDSAPVAGTNGSITNALALYAGGNVQINGGYQGKRTAVADADYTVLKTDYQVSYTSITAARAVTLPAPSTVGSATNPQYFIIKDESGSAATFNVTVTPASGTIDGSASKVISSAYGIVRAYSNGSNYFQW